MSHILKSRHWVRIKNVKTCRRLFCKTLIQEKIWKTRLCHKWIMQLWLANAGMWQMSQQWKVTRWKFAENTKQSDVSYCLDIDLSHTVVVQRGNYRLTENPQFGIKSRLLLCDFPKFRNLSGLSSHLWVVNRTPVRTVMKNNVLK